MSDTPPPSFPVESWRDKLRVYRSSQEVKSHINNVLKGVFPNETFKDSMTIASFLWKPHNYRLKIPFNRFSKLDSTPPSSKVGTMLSFPVQTSSKGIVTIKVSGSLVVQVLKSCLMVIYKGSGWFRLNSRGFEAFIDDKVGSIRDKCFIAVKSLNLGLDLRFGDAIWVRQENTLKGDEFLDSIPKKLFVDDTCFKKVYDDDVEFKDAVYLKSYVKSRVLEDFGGYDRRIGVLEDFFSRSNPLFFLKENVRVVDDVFKFKDFVSLLSDVEKVDFTDWIFNTNFGGGRL